MNINNIKDRFNILHKYHDKIFKDFIKSLDIILDSNISDIEYNNINDWIYEYESQLNELQITLDEFKEHINNDNMELSLNRRINSKICDEVKDIFMPIILIYWMTRLSPIIEDLDSSHE